ARRPRVLALRRAEPGRADDRLRLPGRALALRAHARRRPEHGGALRVLRSRHGARQRLLGDQRRRDAAATLRRAAGARRGRPRRPRLRGGALVRDAADGRPRARHRQALHAAHRPGDDPRRDPLPGPAPGAGPVARGSPRPRSPSISDNRKSAGAKRNAVSPDTRSMTTTRSFLALGACAAILAAGAVLARSAPAAPVGSASAAASLQAEAGRGAIAAGTSRYGRILFDGRGYALY